MPPNKSKVSVEEKISAKTENTAGAEAGAVNEPVSLNSLNFYCLMNVIQYLPIKDRIAAEQVSKLWNSASKASWRNFKTLHFKNDLWGLKKVFGTLSIEDRMKMLESILSRCGKFLTSLNLKGFTFYGQATNLNTKQILNLVKTNCNNLKSFYISGKILINKSSISTLKVIIKNLQNLKCKMDDTVKDKDLKPLFSSCKELETLRITAGESITGDFLYFLNHKKIKELALSSFTHSVSLCYAIQKFETLEKLLIGNLSIGYDSLSDLLESNCQWPTTLKSLCIKKNEFADSSNLISMTTSLTRLQLLDTEITDSMLVQIVQKCSELEFLELEGTDTFTSATDTGIQALSMLPKLEVLRLRFLEITGSTLQHISTLRKFAISGLFELDGKSLCNILLSCKDLEELSIDATDYDDPYDESSLNTAVDFFTTAKRVLKQRHFISNKPLKVVFFNGFVIVTSKFITDTNKVKLFFEAYKKNYYADDSKCRKILDTNDFLHLINNLNCHGFNIPFSRAV